MNKKLLIKRIGIIVDVLMYALMLSQMAYVFVGNVLHEWMGIGFFICLVIHIIIKRHWFKNVFRRNVKIVSSRRFADIVIIMLLLDIVVLMLSSMGVSRTIFPNIHFLGNPDFHRLLATVGLTLAVIHGGMHAYWKASNKKMASIVIAIIAIAAFCIGQFVVPYLNRHLRIVEIEREDFDYSKYSWNDDEPLVVYFTRVGNTDFDDDVDAVSGASLMIEEGELIGNTQFMARELSNAIGCEAKAITLGEYKYPSSYAETCTVGGQELREQLRPKIEKIDVSEYSSVILIYPIWWGTIPMPVASFLEDNDFTNKKIYLVATQGSNGFGSSEKDILELIPNANITTTISIYCDDIPKSREMLIDWFEDKGLILNTK